VLPQVLRLINDAHRQLQQTESGGPAIDPGGGSDRRGPDG